MYRFKISVKRNKKYDVYKNGKYLVSFGDRNYQHYKDKTPLKAWSVLDHNDKKEEIIIIQDLERMLNMKVLNILVINIYGELNN